MACEEPDVLTVRPVDTVQIVKTDTVYLSPACSDTVYFHAWNFGVAPGTNSNETELYRSTCALPENNYNFKFKLGGTVGAKLEFLFYNHHILVHSYTVIVGDNDYDISIEVPSEFNSIRLRAFNNFGTEYVSIGIEDIEF